MSTRGDTSEIEREQTEPRRRQQADEFNRRQSWSEYKRFHDIAAGREHQNLELIDRNARLRERQEIIEQALLPPPTPQELQEREAVQRYREWESLPIAEQIRRQNGANTPLGKMATALERQEAVAHRHQIVQVHLRHRPDFVEIYQGLAQNEAQSIAMAHPHATREQIDRALGDQFDALWQVHGANTPQVLHQLARNRGIYSNAERQHARSQMERAQAESNRRQAVEREQAYAQEREQVRRAVIPIPINDLLSDPRYRHLKELARKHNLSPFNGTGMASY